MASGGSRFAPVRAPSEITRSGDLMAATSGHVPVAPPSVTSRGVRERLPGGWGARFRVAERSLGVVVATPAGYVIDADRTGWWRPVLVLVGMPLGGMGGPCPRPTWIIVARSYDAPAADANGAGCM